MIRTDKGLEGIYGEAMAALMQAPLQNALLIGRLKQGLARDVAVADGSVRLRDMRSGNYMYAVKSLDAFRKLQQSAADTSRVFFLSDDALQGEMEAAGLMPLPFLQWTIDHPVPIPPADPAFHFAPVRPSDLELILSVYKSEEFDRDYVLDIVLRNPTVAAYDGENMAGFVLNHRDGEAGPMVVLPAYRRRGLGCQLLRRITNLLLENGLPVVGHIHLDNQVSIRLHVDAGYQRSPRPVLWVYPAGFPHDI